jgi:phage/plasmid-associated DNA primase
MIAHISPEIHDKIVGNATPDNDYVRETAAPEVHSEDAPANDDSPIHGLTARHYRMLRVESGISDEAIRTAGYRSLGAKEAVATLSILGFNKTQANVGAGLLLRLTLPDDPAPLYQFRPDNPRMGEHGKPIKYETPYGSSQRLILRQSVINTLQDPDHSMVITEGAKKVDALISAGYAAIGGIGVWSFMVARTAEEKASHTPKTLLRDWQKLQLQDRRITIMFDSDAAHNTDIQNAERQLAELLSERGALVSTVRLPTGADGKKQGADDFLARGGKIEEVFATAQPYATKDTILQFLDETPAEGRMQVLKGALERFGTLNPIEWMVLKPELKARIPSLNMNDLERAWAQLHKVHKKEQFLQETEGPKQDAIANELAELWRDTICFDTNAQDWMQWQSGKWAPIDVMAIRERISAHMDTNAPGYTWNVLSGVERLLATKMHATLPMETPGWLPFRNGALELATMTLHPHSATRPFRWQLPYNYDPKQACKLTLAWLREAVHGDAQQVQLLRAFLKAVLTGRADLQRYLENIGPGGTGKSTFMRLLTALVGRENTFTTELKYLESNRFETSGLRHKRLVLITDAERYSGPVNQLKAITGGDGVRMEEKYKKAGYDYPPVLVCISANEPIQSADYTSGLTRRRISMRFTHKPAEPRQLLDWHIDRWVGDLADDIPGVLNWAMAMPDEEMERYIKHTEEAVPGLAWVARQAILETNPLADWANTHLIADATTGPDGVLTTRVNIGVARSIDKGKGYECEDIWLYPNYRAWMDSTGNKAISLRRFTGLLQDLLEHQLKLHVESRNDNTGSYIRGIRLRTAPDKAEPLFGMPKTAPVLDGTDAGMDETRASDEWDGFDGYLTKSDTIPPTPCPDQEREGVPYSEVANRENPSKSIPSVTTAGASHPESIPSVIDAGASHTAPVISADGAAKTTPNPDALNDKDPCPHCGERQMKFFKAGQLVCHKCGKKTLTTWRG